MRSKFVVLFCALCVVVPGIWFGTATAKADTGVTVLTVGPNPNVVSAPMSTELQGVMCKAPNTCKSVSYQTSGWLSSVVNSGVSALSAAIAATPGKKAVMGFSQGALVASEWLKRYAGSATSPAASDMYFVLFGNPQHPLNGRNTLQKTGTPTPYTKYTTVDISREYDGMSDYPNDVGNTLAVATSQDGYTSIHPYYTGVDPNASSNLVKRTGNYTFVLVPTSYLPRYERMRNRGLGKLAEQGNATWKPVVDRGYNRAGFTQLGNTTVVPVR